MAGSAFGQSGVRQKATRGRSATTGVMARTRDFPLRLAQSSQMSLTSRAMSPTVSKETDSGFTPLSDTQPWLGLKPTMPQKEAGRTTEPTVCVPSARGT